MPLAEFHGSEVTKWLAARPFVLRLLLIGIGGALIVFGVSGLRLRLTRSAPNELVPRTSVWLASILAGAILIALSVLLTYLEFEIE